MLGLTQRAEAIAGARKSFLEHDEIPDATIVRPEIYASWVRSATYGLRSDTVRLTRMAGTSTDGELVKASEAVVAGRLETISGMHWGLTLTNEVGCLLRRWVGDSKFERRLDRRSVIPGFSTAESTIGTNASGCALLTGAPILVAGPEHFADDAAHMSSAAAPIRHPLTRRIIGTLSLSLDFRDTNALLLQWVRDLVTLIEQQLRAALSRPDHILFDAYMAAVRDSRHPVLVINEKTVIGNAAAFRSIGTASQPLLWEIASRSAAEHGEQEIVLAPEGAEHAVLARFSPVLDGDAPIGALVRLRMQRTGTSMISTATGHARLSPSPPTLEGLVGASPAWRRFCAEALAAVSAGQPLLVVGERGAGRSAVAHSLARACAAGRPIEVVAPGPQELARLEGTPDDELPPVLVLDGAQALEGDDLSRCSALLTRLDRLSVQVILTARLQEHTGTDEGVRTAATFADWDVVRVGVPALRHRLQDLPALLDAFGTELGGRVTQLVWSPEALQLLHRAPWPTNLTALRSLVRTLLQKRNGSWVSLDDLPPALRASAARRDLGGMEQAEVEAILRALRDAGGNRRQAAVQLGVARSTLYRKMRALGLDLSAANY
ncbi:sigma-54-dependent Fis family transcriptional regulator [Pseudonocardia xishanensis]|uniref:Transcriptional regulator MimR n=1 Tax=Pseudonocardia xishanensis TaxID=630995 RepID=A0ABP8S0U4_9PSEU